MGKKIENLMPESLLDMELAEKFTSSFIEKIEKIRNNLDQHPLYTPLVQPMSILLENSNELLEGDIHKLIRKLQAKSCESDPIPTHILKENVDGSLPVLTKLVNLSLIEGVYCDEWKVAILKSLLKKLGLDLIVKNY